MNNLIKTMAVAALVSLPLTGNAQTENPRGIYKMTTLTGKQGEIKAPYNQYKICTDSITLMLNIQGSFFMIGQNDKNVFNYTGDQPKSEDDKSTLIYDSDADHFTLKWWSEYDYHPYFPKNDWCIEKYEANKYSEMGKIIFDALNGNVATDPENPLIGVWRLIDRVNELPDSEMEMPKQNNKDKWFYVFMPQKCVMFHQSLGAVFDGITYNGKESFTMENGTRSVKWLSEDRIAIEMKQPNKPTDLHAVDILERVTDGNSPLSRIASHRLQEPIREQGITDLKATLLD